MSQFTDFKSSIPGRLLFGVGRFVDRTLNWIINGDFGHTLSATYGRDKPDCPLCQWLHRHVERWHCVRAAKNEGLISSSVAWNLTNGEV